MSTRRGILSTMTAGAALLALKDIAAAKQPTPVARPGGNGFGATASVSVNSGNNSGNQTLTYQENQAIITSSGDIALNQGNSAGGAVIQQAGVASLPNADGSAGAICCPPNIQKPASCGQIKICDPDNCSKPFVPLECVTWLFCNAGS